MKKPTTIIASLLIPLLSSCSSPLPLTPNSIPTPYEVVDPIFPPPKSIEDIYDEITLRGGYIASSLEKNLPQGFAMDIGKIREGEKELNRYITANFLKTNKSKTLVVGSYIGSDSEIEKKVNTPLSTRNYKSAIDTLNQSKLELVQFNDSKINGLRPQEINDFIVMKNEKGKITNINATKRPDLLQETNDIYKLLLRKIYFSDNQFQTNL